MVFEKGLKLFDLVDFAIKPIQSVVSRPREAGLAEHVAKEG